MRERPNREKSNERFYREMAKIADVLTTEQNRQASGEWGKIHLFEMGDFYRAYEWSAWLIR